MSRVEGLIAALCPNGVPHLPIGNSSVSDRVVAGATPKSGRAEFWENGTIPWMSSGEVNKGTVYATDKLITQAAYDATSTNMVPAGAVVIALAGQGKTRGTVARTRIELCTNQSLASIVVADSMDSDFLFYFLKTQYSQLRDVSTGDGSRGGLNLQMIRAYRVPVPPLEVQREIVRTMDLYSQAEADLEAELEAELGVRRLQHAHGWETLLKPDAGWRKLTVGDVAQVFDGPHATPKKTPDGPWYLSISSLKSGRFDFDESAHLADVDLPKWTRRVAPRPGDTLFSYETRLGQAAFWESDADAALGRRMGLLRPDASMVDPRFLTLVYLGPQFQSVIKAKTVSGSTVDRIPIADMASWELLLPPLEEQRRIVTVLDRFDALVNDLRSHLAAEVDARRKQYEYYRDRLLTFKELAA